MARGIPTGGQFTAKSHTEVDISLSDEPSVYRSAVDVVEEPRSRFSDDIEDATDELLDMENTAYENWVAAGSPNPDADGPHRRWATRARQEKALPQIVLDRRQGELRAKVKGSLENPSLSGDTSDRAEKIAEVMGLEQPTPDDRHTSSNRGSSDTISNARKQYDKDMLPGGKHRGHLIQPKFHGPETRAEEIEQEQRWALEAEEARRNPQPAAPAPHDSRSNAKKAYDDVTLAGEGWRAPETPTPYIQWPRPAMQTGRSGNGFAPKFHGPETRSEELREEADEADRKGRPHEASQLRRQAADGEVRESAERDRKAEQRRAQDQPAPAAEAPKRRWFGR